MSLVRRNVATAGVVAAVARVLAHNGYRAVAHKMRGAYTPGNDRTRRRWASEQSAKRARAPSTPPVTAKKAKTHTMSIASMMAKPRGGVKGFPGVTKVNKGKAFKKKSALGVSLHFREGGTTTSNTDQFLGHASAPVVLVFSQAWLSIVKRLLIKAEFPVSGPDIATGFIAGDAIVLYYSLSDGAAQVSTVYSPTTTDTMNSVTAWLNNSSRPWNAQTDGLSNQVTFIGIRYAPVVLPAAGLIPSAAAYVPLRFATLTMHGSSYLKYQNRTIDKAGDVEADDIDNEPLRLRIYEGKGTGMVSINVGNAPLPQYTSNTFSGIIFAKPASTTTGAIQELPDAEVFDKVTRTSTDMMGPGEIKTSRLTFKYNGTWNKLFQSMNPNGRLGAQQAKGIILSKGEFRIMGMEKMIKYTDVTDQPISTVYQMDYNLFSEVHERRSYQSTANFTTSYGNAN